MFSPPACNGYNYYKLQNLVFYLLFYLRIVIHNSLLQNQEQ